MVANHKLVVGGYERKVEMMGHSDRRFGFLLSYSYIFSFGFDFKRNLVNSTFLGKKFDD